MDLARIFMSIGHRGRHCARQRLHPLLQWCPDVVAFLGSAELIRDPEPVREYDRHDYNRTVHRITKRQLNRAANAMADLMTSLR